jgi:hypothetical protein
LGVVGGARKQLSCSKHALNIANCMPARVVRSNPFHPPEVQGVCFKVRAAASGDSRPGGGSGSIGWWATGVCKLWVHTRRSTRQVEHRFIPPRPIIEW